MCCCCCSTRTVVRLLYGFLMVAALALTLISLFTPQWRHLEISVTNKTSGQNLQQFYNLGVTLSKCMNSFQSLLDCINYTNAPQYHQISIICLAIGAASCALALLYGFVVACCSCCLWCFTCCCDNCLSWPFLIFAGVGCTADTIAVAVFGIKSGTDLPTLPASLDDVNFLQNSIGWSLIVGIVAIIVLFLDFLLAISLVRMHKVAPE